MSDFIILADGDTRHAVAALASFSSNGLVSRVHIAGDGYEALDFLFSERMLDTRAGAQPSLILLDLGLPITGGLQVLRTVKTDPRSAKIPVVVLSSSASDLDIHAAIKFGADSVIEKPLTFHKLLIAARRLGVPLYREGHGFAAGDRLGG
jgi:two-component system, response regulator